MTTTLLSVGIMSSGALDRYVERLFRLGGGSVVKQLVIACLLGLVLIFLIPQAFARVILLGGIYSRIFIARDEVERKALAALIFGAFGAVTGTYMMFLSGDIVLNYGAVNFSGPEMAGVLNFANWFKYMGLPGALATLVLMGVIYLVFRNEFAGFSESMIQKTQEGQKENRLALLIMLAIVIFWMLEPVHGLPAWIGALVAVIIFLAMKIIEPKDFKSIQPELLIFLTVIFSIGKVFGSTGITEIIFQKLEGFMAAGGTGFLLTTSILIMVLHMLIGSSMATMSVVLPVLVPLAQAKGFEPVVITLISYIMVNLHFLLPVHHATMMIGTARDFYPDKFMFRLGLPMTILVLLIIFGIFLPWWKIIGLI